MHRGVDTGDSTARLLRWCRGGRKLTVGAQPRGQRSTELSSIIGVVCAVVIFLGCLVAVLVVFSLGESYDEEPTPRERSTAANQVVPSAPIGLPASIEMTSSPATQPTHGPSSGTRSSTRTKPSQMTPTSNQLPRSPLICTVSVKFTNVSSIPGDGLCDFIFYESFYLKNNPTGWSDSGLDHFLRLSQNMRRTDVGASFSPVGDRLFSDAVSGDLNAAVDNLRSRGVSHYGMLSLYRRYISSPKFLECLKILQDIREHVNSQVPPDLPTPVLYTVVGALFDEPLLYQNIDRSNGITEPSFYVALTHVPYADRKRRDCRILPMTMLDFPADPPRRKLKYGISIKEAMSNLKWTESHKWDFTWMAISFSMRGHLYAASNTSGGKNADHLFRPCKDFTGPRVMYNVKPQMRCPSSGRWTYRFRDDVLGEYSYDTVGGLTMVFDSEISMKRKICEAKAGYPDVPFSIAAYDVEYDSDPAGCPTMQIGLGAFRRLKALRRLNEFIDKEFKNASYLQKCLDVPVS
ncbi:uncharacterized protein [Dermacentor albipictus]|uniref:uncharacterized protein n=1 Tax=Dermacentor albipictus TaxID=60249 RepID=UPI0038FC4AB9